ncbi:hypothetical protein J4760_04020 [Salinicoccus sp. ID82-1]|uniref:hypothetical protein n=1 Tax=Salinicoccus sp. ID82-1 TaxID=2820269 RepID=UPI001F1BC201|nr:hypothetical protein [Salinicoccus sp. ID82-1]MCG1009218.1 hypothetical protein [Salinicoccus sp. ID82-1]
MSDEFYRRIGNELQTKGIDTQCPKCSGEKSFIAQTYRILFDDGEELISKPLNEQNPFVALACNNCGHSDFYSLEKLGVFN